MVTRLKRTLGGLVLLGLVILSCKTPETYQGEPNIYGVLTADSSAVVMVGRTLAIDDTMEVDSNWNYLWNGVSGAGVTLRNGGESFDLAELEDSTGYYRNPSCMPSALETWELEVSYPEGELIQAKTTIPGDFEITAPEGDSVYWLDTLTWSPSTGAAGYLVGALKWFPPREEDTVEVDSSFFFYATLLSADSLMFDLSQTGIAGLDSVRLVVAALDSSAYDYRYFTMYCYWLDLRPEDYMHIPGAWGVFGSRTLAWTKTLLVKW